MHRVPHVSAAQLGAVLGTPVLPQRISKKKAPICLACLQRRARKLPRLGYFSRLAVFCSLQCAACHAMRDFLGSGHLWCGIHRKWTPANSVCAHCEFEAGAAGQLAGILPPEACPPGKEAGHG